MADIHEVLEKISTLESENKKLKFHIDLLVEAIYQKSNAALFFIELNFSRDYFDKLCNVFDVHENFLIGGQFSAHDLERDIESSVGLNCQEIKSLIGCFIKMNRYEAVCYEYLKGKVLRYTPEQE